MKFKMNEWIQKDFKSRDTKVDLFLAVEEALIVDPIVKEMESQETNLTREAVAKTMGDNLRSLLSNNYKQILSACFYNKDGEELTDDDFKEKAPYKSKASKECMPLILEAMHILREQDEEESEGK